MPVPIWHKVGTRQQWLNKYKGKREWEGGGKERAIGRQEIREKGKVEGKKEESASVAEAPWMGEPKCE